MTQDLDRHVAFALRDAARRAILSRYTPGQAIAADYKTVGEAVTVADRESEGIIAEHLCALIPGAGIVGEEAVHHNSALLERLGQGTCWIIDPLDGTGNFAQGQQPFGMLVALAHEGVPVAGWIYDPVNERLCSAHAGHGATIDGAPFKASQDVTARPLVAVTRLFAQEARRDAAMAYLATICDVIDSPRCAADQYPRVALGGNDATVFTRTIAWDHAAGVIFLNEAGGQAACQDGTPYRCDRPDNGLVIARNPSVWQQIADCLNDAGIALAGAHLP